MRISESNSGERGNEREVESPSRESVAEKGGQDTTSSVHVRGRGTSYDGRAEYADPHREPRPHHSCGGGGCPGCTNGIYWYPKHSGTLLQRIAQERRATIDTGPAMQASPCSVLPIPGVILPKREDPAPPFVAPVIKMPVHEGPITSTRPSTAQTSRVLRFPQNRGGA